MAIALAPVVLDTSPLGNILLPQALLGEYTLAGAVLPRPLLGEYALAGAVLPAPQLTEAVPTTLYITPSGGMMAGGMADVALDPFVVGGTGGGVVAGIAGVIYNQIAINQIIAQGGARVSGAAGVSVNWTVQVATGGARVSGTALLQSPADFTGTSAVVVTSTATAGGTHSTAADSITEATSTAESGLVFDLAGASSAAAVSEAAAPRAFFEAVASTVAAVGDASAYRLIELLASSLGQLTGSVNAAAVYSVTADSIAQIVSSLQFVTSYVDGWAYNLNTGAPSFYEGFNFNSFAQVGNAYYGCNDAGIYLLSGDTDNSVPIEALITTGTNGKNVYRVDAVYAGARSAQPMNLTCRVEGVEYTYAFRSATDSMEPTRVTPGKGLRGRYWQFEISNQDGADIEIDALEMMTAESGRRL